MKKKVLIVSSIILLIDQLSKIIISSLLGLRESRVLIKGFFNLTYIRNKGAAWSIFANHRFLLVLIGIFALYFVYTFIKDFKDNKRNILAFGFLIGGIFGNLIDRLFLGYVRDFLDFKIFGYDYPVFNIADSAILIGVCLLIYAIIKGEENGSSSSKKNKN